MVQERPQVFKNGSLYANTTGTKESDLAQVQSSVGKMQKGLRTSFVSLFHWYLLGLLLQTRTEKGPP